MATKKKGPDISARELSRAIETLLFTAINGVLAREYGKAAHALELCAGMCRLAAERKDAGKA
jgi:hypothetical protein